MSNTLNESLFLELGDIVKLNAPANSDINEHTFFSEKKIALYKGPTLVNSKILFGDNDGKIHIIDPNNGSDLGDLFVGKLALAPIPASGKVFFLTENGKLLAYK